jgi:hypothetical protein
VERTQERPGPKHGGMYHIKSIPLAKYQSNE